jgi:hypothetical protein
MKFTNYESVFSTRISSAKHSGWAGKEEFVFLLLEESFMFHGRLSG